MTEELLYFNGINGATGAYLLRPQTPAELSQRFIRGTGPPENLPELKDRFLRKTRGFLGVKEDVDATRLAEAGWGILFAQADRERVPAIMDALKELLEIVGVRGNGWPAAKRIRGWAARPSVYPFLSVAEHFQGRLPWTVRSSRPASMSCCRPN